RQAPQRNQLTCALGDAGQFEPEVAPQTLTVSAGDAFLLCTDGCWGPVDETSMTDDLLSSGNAARCLEKLHTRIVARNDPRPGKYSAIAMWRRDDDGPDTWQGMADDETTVQP